MVAIIGAGPIGAAVAQRLAERARVRDIRLIDESIGVAAGKALDIRQSGPIGRFDVTLTAAPDPIAAAGAAAIVIADAVTDGEWTGERGLALVARLVRAGATAPFVFAGGSQVALMETAVRELHVPADRLIGAAAAAQVSAARALIGLELGLSGAAVHVALAGRPPAFTVGWSSATAGGSRLADRIAPHRLLALSESLARLWPPGPQVIGAATARLVEALVLGSRLEHQAMTILDGEFGAKGVAAMLPLELGDGRVRRRVLPTLSAQETTAMLGGPGFSPGAPRRP